MAAVMLMSLNHRCLDSAIWWDADMLCFCRKEPAAGGPAVPGWGSAVCSGVSDTRTGGEDT